jgi:hypoxanthine phosphoribosyltransferase
LKLIYSTAEIDKQILRVAEEINRDYAGKQPLFVGVLKGCTIFLAHLFVKLRMDARFDFLTVSSYRHGVTSDELKLVQDLDCDIGGRDVVLVEDILDSGKTLRFVNDLLAARGVKSLETVLFVNKEMRKSVDIPKPKYVCFNCEEEGFLVGFGFDHAEKYRNLPAVYALGEEDKI